MKVILAPDMDEHYAIGRHVLENGTRKYILLKEGGGFHSIWAFPDKVISEEYVNLPMPRFAGWETVKVDGRKTTKPIYR